MTEHEQSNPSDFGIMDPHGRLKALSDYGNTVEIDHSVPPRRYYRSGLEMVRMANVYLEEGSLENAFILYMKFMTLFLEKIRHHPDFKTVSPTDRAVNAEKLREVLPKAEKLKSRLLEQYQREYDNFCEEQRRREKERLRLELEAKKRQTVIPPIPDAKEYEKHSVPVVVVPSIPTDSIVYPDTFEPKKPTSLDIMLNLPRNQPSIDRSTKPASLLSPSIQGKVGLRTVIVPSRLMGRFMHLALGNTEKNIETCGILAGKLDHDRLIITHLLVPKQIGTADSCTTQNEEEIFEYQDRHDLITFGWIHTHPSQTAFLSSVDLHTHCSYQRMMPEAVAIVCAPRYQENGFFMLTPNYGLDFIANCKQTGFHPHPTEPPLFMNADHSKLDSSAPIEVVDLRR
ncbi:hypothetical protein R5R35_013732 [Gryllus longicercus]|uniref:MPN domain-containing protein n=1 Tax=Gryllus longicercus TaxID=2509291 RepID=A0AAN9WAD1_9ORTH